MFMKAYLLRFWVAGILCILPLTPDFCQADFFGDESFVIADFSDGRCTKGQILSAISGNEIGVCLELVLSEDSSDLYIQSNYQKDLSFNWLINELVKVSDIKLERVTPVFLRCNQGMKLLDSLIRDSELEAHLFHLPQDERWPEVNEMIGQKKNIVLFSIDEIKQENSKLLYAWNYMADFPVSSIEEPYFDGSFAAGDISRSLLLVNSLRNITPIEKRTGDEFNQNPIYLSHLLKCWQLTGKKPNFIFVEGSPGAFPSVAYKLNLIESVSGKVTHNEKPLETVYWRGSSKSITNGYFSFPYSGDELSLTPFRPGYTFIPENIIINPESREYEQLHFFALPLSLSDGLEAHFSFADEGLI